MTVLYIASLIFVVVLATLLLVVVQAEESIIDNPDQLWTCNVRNDPCPFPLQFNGICQSSFVEECKNGDCYDCDPCRQYRLDCASCLDNGCYWCPGDASCSGSPLYPQLLGLTAEDDGGVACLVPADYQSEQCAAAAATDDDGDFFSDPLFAAQEWVFNLINVQPAWEDGYTGSGVRIRINDNGIESDHVEFDGRFDLAASCEHYETPNDGRSDDFHGTSVAAIAAGGGDNDVCSVGVAPGATLSSCNIIDYPDQSLAEKVDSFDISQNSYGIDGCSIYRKNRQMEETTSDGIGANQCPFTYVEEEGGTPTPCDFCGDFLDIDISCERAIVLHCTRYYKEDTRGCLEFLDLLLGGNCEFNVISDRQRNEILKGIVEGRDGKGNVYIFAGGNALEFGDHSNLQPYTNSRFVITVGAVAKNGYHASYSTPGPSLFVTAPGGDKDTTPNHVTADIGGGCRDATYATSLASPVASGVVALMLEANPALTWRDVQHILATTSRVVDDDPLDTTARVNEAGVWHSEWYGFGIVDAGTAVETAKTWSLVGPEEMIMAESGKINLPLSDGPSTPVVTSLTLATDVSAANFVVDSVAVYLALDHSSRGHLQISLVSPQGTESVLLPGQRPENSQLADDERWKLLTLRSWGESGIGDWTLSIVDTVDGDAGDCVSLSWDLPSNGNEFQCFDLARADLCRDGVLDPFNRTTPEQYESIFGTRYDGLLASEACCECGGGKPADAVVDRLREWRLVAYGQTETGNDVTLPPSMGDNPSSSSPPTGDDGAGAGALSGISTRWEFVNVLCMTCMLALVYANH